MKRTLTIALAATALAAVGGIATRAADTQIIIDEPPVAVEQDVEGGVKIGYLACEVGSGGGYVLGSAKELDCVFRSSFKDDPVDRYAGSVKKLGVDLGYTARGKIVWAVFAPTAGYHRGSLGGVYYGASAEATLGAGLGANVLLGGTKGSIQLQPVSVTGQLGLNVAAAGTTVSLASVR